MAKKFVEWEEVCAKYLENRKHRIAKDDVDKEIDREDLLYDIGGE